MHCDIVDDSLVAVTLVHGWLLVYLGFSLQVTSIVDGIVD